MLKSHVSTKILLLKLVMLVLQSVVKLCKRLLKLITRILMVTLKEGDVYTMNADYKSESRLGERSSARLINK